MAEASVQAVGNEARGGAGNAPAALAVQNPMGVSMEGHSAWPMISRLPVLLAVNIPLTGLKVRDLLELKSGQTIPSEWATTEDVPLKVDGVNLCWGEFEVVEQQMALRLTSLA